MDDWDLQYDDDDHGDSDNNDECVMMDEDFQPDCIITKVKPPAPKEFSIYVPENDIWDINHGELEESIEEFSDSNPFACVNEYESLDEASESGYKSDECPHYFEQQFDDDEGFCRDRATLKIRTTESPCDRLSWRGEFKWMKDVSGYIVRYYTTMGKSWNVLHMELLVQLEHVETKQEDLTMIWLRFSDEHVKEILPYLDTKKGSGAGTWISVNNVEFVSYDNKHTNEREEYFKPQVGYQLECSVYICSRVNQCVDENSSEFDIIAVKTKSPGGWGRELFENSGYRSLPTHITKVHLIRDRHISKDSDTNTNSMMADLFTTTKKNNRCSIEGWIHYASPCLVDPLTQQKIMFLSLFTAVKAQGTDNIHYHSINVILRNASVYSVQDYQSRLKPGQAILLYGIRCTYNSKDGYVLDSSSGLYHDNPYELLTSLWLLEDKGESFDLEMEIPGYHSPYFHSLSNSPFHSGNDIFMTTIVQSYLDKVIYSDFTHLWKQLSNLDSSPGQKFHAFIRVSSLSFHFETNHTNPQSCSEPFLSLRCGYKPPPPENSCMARTKLRVIQNTQGDIQVAYLCKKGHQIQKSMGNNDSGDHQQQQPFYLFNARVELCDENKDSMKCYVRTSCIHSFFSGESDSGDEQQQQAFITELHRIHQVIRNMDAETQSFYQDILRASTRQELIQILLQSTPGVVEYLFMSMNNAYYSSPLIVRVVVELPKNYSKKFNAFSEQWSSMVVTVLTIQDIEKK
jgi:hypothetical protein